MKRMRFTLLFFALLLLAACSTQTAPKDAKTVYDAVIKGTGFQELTPMDGEITAILLDVEQSMFADFAVGLDTSRYTPEAVFILTAKDEQGKKVLEEALTVYRDNLLSEYQDYRPQEAGKVQQARVQSKGLQLALLVAPDLNAAQNALDKAWK